MRRKRLICQDALGGAVSFLTAEKRTCQSSAETRILHNLLTSLCFRLSWRCLLCLKANMVTASKRRQIPPSEMLHEWSSPPYIGDQRMAVVTWGGRAFVCDDVDSAEHAFEQVFRDIEG